MNTYKHVSTTINNTEQLHYPPNSLDYFVVSLPPHPQLLASDPIIFPFPKVHISGTIQGVAFLSGFFHLAQCV